MCYVRVLSYLSHHYHHPFTRRITAPHWETRDLSAKKLMLRNKFITEITTPPTAAIPLPFQSKASLDWFLTHGMLINTFTQGHFVTKIYPMQPRYSRAAITLCAMIWSLDNTTWMCTSYITSAWVFIGFGMVPNGFINSQFSHLVCPHVVTFF